MATRAHSVRQARPRLLPLLLGMRDKKDRHNLYISEEEKERERERREPLRSSEWIEEEEKANQSCEVRMDTREPSLTAAAVGQTD